MFTYIFNVHNLTASLTSPGPEYAEGLSITSHIDDQFPTTLTSIEYSATTRQVVLRSAIGNPLPLFWGWRQSDLIVSDNPAAILHAIKGSDAITLTDIDKVAFIEGILFDGPLVDRTLFTAVKKMQTAETVVFDLAAGTHSRQWRWLPSIQTNTAISYVQAKARAKKLIAEVGAEFQPFTTGVVLPITGGLDSRMLAALARHQSDAPIHSYTFQRGWSFESWCAKKVAQQLNTEHYIFNLGEGCYKTFAKEVVQKSGGLVTGMHTHGIYSCEHLLSESVKSLPRMFGYYGDPITGAMTETVADGGRAASPEAILKKYGQSLFPELVAEYKSEILADLQQTFAAFQQSGSPAHCFHEFWKIQQRQNNLITHLFGYHRAVLGADVRLPFIHEDFINFFLSLPLEYRFNRKLFKEVSAELYPQSFALPSMHYPANSFFAKLETGCERLEDVLNRISIRQELFLSPFRYEHHDKNLQNYLSQDIAAGVKLMSELYNCPPVTISYPMWKFSSSAKEHYRLAALGYLVG